MIRGVRRGMIAEWMWTSAPIGVYLLAGHVLGGDLRRVTSGWGG